MALSNQNRATEQAVGETSSYLLGLAGIPRVPYPDYISKFVNRDSGEVCA
jgi:hypothetical protein